MDDTEAAFKSWVVGMIGVVLIFAGGFTFSSICNWSHDRAIETCIRNNYEWYEGSCTKFTPEEEK